jgi:hypothetical protein
MKTGMLIAAVVFASGCASSYPVPTQRMADAQSAARSAQELGADQLPASQLHLKLAQEQIAKANTVLENNDTRRADFMLIRAKADAELALALAREQKSKAEAQAAVEQANAQAATNQGALR